jgi:16S rRNA (adenine1518-N6/adenine1519-N6)-dimethyltransferase
MVRPKKHFGQHFLTDESIAKKIAESLMLNRNYHTVLEIGPGMGMLTKYLLQNSKFQTWAIEIDKESVAYLKKHYPSFSERIIQNDFLEIDLTEFSKQPFAVIGNFPYNISTEILFKILHHRQNIPEVVGMFQKEVAQRIASAPGNRQYGIPSVLLQAYYDIEYLFTVDEYVFSPPPKIKSAVIRLSRNSNISLGCNEDLFKTIVKTAFNQRRKTLRNALKVITSETTLPFLEKRAEQLHYSDFIELTNKIEEEKNS